MSTVLPARKHLGLAGHLVLLWGVFGVSVILVRAILSLTPKAVEALGMNLTPLQWVVLVVWVVFMGIGEGYKGFQTQFSPRVVKRSLHLARHPHPLSVLGAPLHAMGLFDATRKRKIIAWGIVLMVATLVVLVRYLPQPWRGIVDAGVVLGLVWGLVSMLGFYAAALAGREPSIEADLPVP